MLLRDAVLLRPRSARADSIACIRTLNPQPKIIQPENIPASGPSLLVMNHYTRAGFQAWWIAMGISAVVPTDIHWLMTSAWTFSENKYLQNFTPATRWFFSRVTRVYGFTTTPPMPPDPDHVEERARSVRQVLTFARESDQPVIGIAPEGSDQPGGILGTPPPGVGRFIKQLAKHCKRIIPIGVYEDDNRLNISFGEPFELEITANHAADQIDRDVSRQVMCAIAKQLPASLRGAYDQYA